MSSCCAFYVIIFTSTSIHIFSSLWRKFNLIPFWNKHVKSFQNSHFNMHFQCLYFYNFLASKTLKISLCYLQNCPTKVIFGIFLKVSSYLIAGSDPWSLTKFLLKIKLRPSSKAYSKHCLYNCLLTGFLSGYKFYTWSY